MLQWSSRATDEESLAVWGNPRRWPECNAGTMARIAYHEGPPNATRRAFFFACPFHGNLKRGSRHQVGMRLSGET